MAGAIVWYVAVLGSAILFDLIGVYAQKREKPMWFWSGSEVDSARISDVRQYNRENGRMWMRYSLWFWAAGLAEILSTAAALILLALGGTVGLALLIFEYTRICRKYSMQ